MTYNEYITKTVARFNLSADDIELILINQAALIPNPDAPVNVQTARLALCHDFATLIPLADVREGDYSAVWNWEAIKLWYDTMCAEAGVTPVTKL